MEPGDLVTLSCKAGYGIAYHPLRKGESSPPPVDIPDGTVLMYIKRDDIWSDIKMQPMVYVAWRSSLLSIDERFLAPVPDLDPVV